MKQIVMRCLCVYLCILSSVDSHKRSKRIIGGRDLPNHKFYSTQFVVSLQRTHACTSDQFDHKLLDCEHKHVCGGSLITEDFVLTACHCLTFENWYSNPPPIRENLTLGDLPPYIDDRIHHKILQGGDPIIYRKEVVVQHTLHNAMTIFAGHPESRKKAPQRRHAAKFFVHHLCAGSEEFRHPELWAEDYYELDVGLVKTCYPFDLNDDVQLAPLAPFLSMEKHLYSVMKIAHACLFVGWGLALRPSIPGALRTNQGFAALGNTYFPEMLQHSFRYIQCNRQCTVDRHACMICSMHHGAQLSATRAGDSGSPVICDGFFTAVHSTGVTVSDWVERNYTTSREIAVVCVKDFITLSHLSYLRALADESFHYINGVPADGKKP